MKTPHHDFDIIASPPRVVGLFAGIGGLEVGLAKAGFSTQMFCERDRGAQRVLAHHFPNVPLVGDIRELRSLGSTDVVCAGFPCQDLSQAGKTAGIEGEQSGIVEELFRLIDASTSPEWIIIENVPFMLHLARGQAMATITRKLEERHYTWAYRVINAQAFGLPQRRKRVVILASLHGDVRSALLAPSEGTFIPCAAESSYGFYWTEGNTGLGWALDAVPTLKGGSNLGIPSPPAIWIPGKGVYTPDIRDAERLQGFQPNWTSMASEKKLAGVRWKLVGNSVAVPMAEWLGRRIVAVSNQKRLPHNDVEVATDSSWLKAGWGCCGNRFLSSANEWPVTEATPPLLQFLKFPLRPLSASATSGFYKRASASSLKLHVDFLEGLQSHLQTILSQ